MVTHLGGRKFLTWFKPLDQPSTYGVSRDRRVSLKVIVKKVRFLVLLYLWFVLVK